jgi:hypothetical protein
MFNKGLCRGCGAYLLLFQPVLSVMNMCHGYVINVKEWTMLLIFILPAEFNTNQERGVKKLINDH